MRRHDRDGFKPWPIGPEGSGHISTVAGGHRKLSGSDHFAPSGDDPQLSPAVTAEFDASSVGYLTRDRIERLLKPAEAANVLGVTVKQLAIWRSKGGGPRFVRISHKVVMYRHQTLLEWACEREFGSAHEARLSKT
jgi:hypothetical protein